MLNSVPGDRTGPYRIRLVRRRLILLSETFPRFRNSSARGMGSIRNVLGARFSLHRLGPRGRTNIYCCCFFLCWIITRTHSSHRNVFVWVFKKNNFLQLFSSCSPSCVRSVCSLSLPFFMQIRYDWRRNAFAVSTFTVIFVVFLVVFFFFKSH